MRDAIYARLGKSCAAGDYLNLLHKRDIEWLVRESVVNHCRIITNRFVFRPLDYVVAVDWSGG